MVLSCDVPKNSPADFSSGLAVRWGVGSGSGTINEY